MTKKSLVLPEISPNSSLPYPLPRPASVGATASFAIKKRFLTHLEVGTNIVSIPNALVESMQASSPTHIKAGNAAVTSHFAGDCYNAWLVSILVELIELLSYVNNSSLVLTNGVWI